MVETELPVMMTVSNAAAIEKGTLMQLTDPLTASAHSAGDQNFAGIAAEEKIANDGKTKISVYRGGIFKMVTIAAVTVGNAVALSATANKVKASVAADVASKTIGLALETSGGDTETILVEIRPGANNTAYA